MKFLEIDIRNFLSFGDLTYSISLHDAGLVLIEGENRDDPSARSNGSGKSALIEALVWCLYGVLMRGERLTGDAVVNRVTGKDCEVKVVFDLDGHRYIVYRYRKVSSRSGMRLSKDAVDITTPSVADTEAKLVQLLGMSVQTFLSTVVFGQGEGYRFSTLTDAEQKEVLDQALGIEQYSRALEKAREDSAALRGDVSVAFNALKARQLRIDALAERIEDLKKKSKTFASIHEGKVASLRKRWRKLLKESRVRSAVSLEDAEKEYQKVCKELEKARDDVAKLDRSIMGLEVDIESYEKKIADLDKRLARLTKMRGGNCPVCEQFVDVAHIEDAKATISKEIRGLKKEAGEVATVVAKYEVNRDGIKGARDTLQKSAKHLAGEIDKLHREQVKRESLVQQSKEALTAYKKAKREENPYEALAVTDTLAHDKHVTAYTFEEDALQDMQAKLERYDFWIEAFGTKGLRSLLIDTALPFLNARVEEYANILSDGNLSIEFNTQSTLKSGKTTERFEVKVTNKFGASNYDGCSAGERAKIDLCVGLALQALVASRAGAVNLAIFDEPFESLDDTAMERVITLLTDSLTRESVFVITHSEALKSYFPSSITVIKEGGVSRVEV